ncbi:uncharacterized protein LOC144100413 [Amblyomma americanum]
MAKLAKISALLAVFGDLFIFTVKSVTGDEDSNFQHFFDLGEDCKQMMAAAQTCLVNADLPGADRYSEKLRFSRVRENMNNCLQREFNRGFYQFETCKAPTANDTLHDCLRIGLQTYEAKLIGAEARRFIVHVKDCVFERLKQGRAYVERMTTVLAGQAGDADREPLPVYLELPLKMTTSGRTSA